MILDTQIPELDTYRSTEQELAVQSRAEWADFVVFGNNECQPVHGWFRFKEGFSSSLLQTIINEFGADFSGNEFSLLEPFSGVGTTLLSAQSIQTKKINALGIERNPFIRFVADTKLRWAEMCESSLAIDGNSAISASLRATPGLPALSSISEGRCISRHIAQRLIAIDDACKKSGRNRPFLRLGLAAAIETLSRVRRDGRALRIVSKPTRHISPVLTAIWGRMAHDVSVARRCFTGRPPVYPVLLGDGRNPISAGVAEESIDLIVTSPPYPNNIDYTEVYKLELWLLGFVRGAKEFLSLRHATFRSHPTFNKSLALPSAFQHELSRGRLKHVLGELMERIELSDEKWRARMLTAYFADIWTSVENFKRVLSKRGRAVFVVGNSLHGTKEPILVATDLILAIIAECHGLKASITIARALKRRLAGNHFLRESVVVIKKK